MGGSVMGNSHVATVAKHSCKCKDCLAFRKAAQRNLWACGLVNSGTRGQASELVIVRLMSPPDKFYAFSDTHQPAHQYAIYTRR
jgi:hypothetical protein